MRKLTTIITGGVILTSMVIGISLYQSPVSAPADPGSNIKLATTDTAERQKQLKEWQEKVKAWDATRQNQPKNQAQTSTSQSAMSAVEQLPVTGPSQAIVLFAATVIASGLAHYFYSRQTL